MKLISAFLLLFTAACASPSPKSNSLILNLFGDDPMITRERVAAAAEATSPNGWLVIDYAAKEDLRPPVEVGHGLSMPIEQAVVWLPDSVKRRILLTRFAEPYPWIRDSSYGWQISEGGRYRVNAYEKGNQGSVFSAAAIVTLLNSCADSPLDLPKMRRVPLQEGMLVSNGAGLCVANKRVHERNHEGDDYSVLADLGCKKVIYSLDWEDWRKQGHPNGHIDMSVAFVSPNVAVIPKLDSDCRTDFKTGWDDLKTQLHEAGLQTLEIPVATGCIENPPVVRTYSNMVILQDTLLIAKFIPPTAEQAEKYKFYNNQAVQILADAMERGQIPRRKIVEFPIGREIKGGSVHCMSINVPGPLSRCSQVHLDSVLAAKADEGTALARRLDTSTKTCKDAADTLATLEFISEHVGDRSLRALENGGYIRLSPESIARVQGAVSQLKPQVTSRCIHP